MKLRKHKDRVTGPDLGRYKAPHLDWIAEQIRTAGDAIIDAIVDHPRSAQHKGRPLCVVLGENHAVLEHQLLQAFVVKGLQARGLRIAFGMERPHNALRHAFNAHARAAGVKKSALSPENIQKMDTDGKAALNEEMLGTSLYTDQAGKYCAYYLQRAGISAGFNDAARQYRGLFSRAGYLDLSDPQTALMVKTLGGAGLSRTPFFNKRISRVERFGMYVRNKMMVEKAIEHAARARADIYIQNCGSDHVRGREGQLPYRESVEHLFHEQKLDTSGIVVKPAGKGPLRYGFSGKANLVNGRMELGWVTREYPGYQKGFKYNEEGLDQEFAFVRELTDRLNLPPWPMESARNLRQFYAVRQDNLIARRLHAHKHQVV